jgi:hypothetical protein
MKWCQGTPSWRYERNRVEGGWKWRGSWEQGRSSVDEVVSHCCLKRKEQSRHTGKTTGTPPLMALLPSMWAFELTHMFS